MDKRLKFLNAMVSFESAARHQSYSKAADELFVSQAAVSQQMRQLEQGLNCKLFIRNGRTMELTDNGVKLLHACQTGFNHIINGLNNIQQEQIPGDLTITSTQAFCSLWLMPRLYRFSQLHPDINIRILGSNQKEDLRKKHIDVAIRFSFTEMDLAPDHFHVEPFGGDSAYPVCTQKMVDSCKIKSPEDLLKCRLIYLANESRVTWQSWFEHAGVKGYKNHDKKTEVTSTDMALSAVLAGHGITLAATGLVSQFLASGQVIIPFKIKHPLEWRRFIIYDSNSAKSKRIAIFTQWLKQEMAHGANDFSIEVV